MRGIVLLSWAEALLPMTLCTLIRDEKIEYLEEWVDFQIRQGVGRVVLYDDHSVDKAPLARLALSRGPSYSVRRARRDKN